MGCFSAKQKLPDTTKNPVIIKFTSFEQGQISDMERCLNKKTLRRSMNHRYKL